MKPNIKALLCGGLFVAACQTRALAQTQPASSYTFSNLTSGIRYVSGYGYKADDFAYSALNASGGTIYVSATLTSTDPAFQFQQCSQKGSFTYPTETLSAIGDPTGIQMYAWNVLTVAVLGTGAEFIGSLDVSSSGGQDFYMFTPGNFTATTPNWDSSACTAYYDAWQDGGPWTPSWYWDGTNSRLVSPYANYWHLHDWWTVGWNTNITIENNNSSNSMTYTVHYGSSQNAGVPYRNCNYSYTLGMTSNAETVSPGGSQWSGNLRDDILKPAGGTTDEVNEDGFLYITATPWYSGTYPTSSVSALSSGYGLCGSSSCPLAFSCQ